MSSTKITCRIHENSWLAALAAFKLRSRRMAVTMGCHIYLWNTDKDTFLSNTAWLKHELCHVRQFRHYGFFRFLWLYCGESIRKGYYHNKFEQEARAAERQAGDASEYLFLPG